MLSIKEIIFVVHVNLVKLNVMQKLDWINIITQPKVQSLKHLRSNSNHYFTWAVTSNAPKNAITRDKLEASYIALWKPDLNEKNDVERVDLFRNGAT